MLFETIFVNVSVHIRHFGPHLSNSSQHHFTHKPGHGKHTSKAEVSQNFSADSCT